MADRIPDEPYLNIDPTRQPALRHRSGWSYALAALAPLHNPDGVLLDSFIERTFSWFERAELRQERIPYREPWVGIVHNPPGIPVWHDYHNSPQAILERDSFRRSLPHCRGLFVLSDYLRDWLAPRVSVPVRTLIHPTERPALRFTLDRFRASPVPRVIQIGWWLRRLHSIFRLPTRRSRKQMLCAQDRYFGEVLRREQAHSALTAAQRDSVEMVPFVGDAEYDRLLSESVVFCDLIDSSANNTVVECIVRETPLLINRLPAVEEYLGRDYPLYFSTLDEAAEKLERFDAVASAHEHLRRLPKEPFSQEAFRTALARSDIYRGLRDVLRRRRGAAPRSAAGPQCCATVHDEHGRGVELNLALLRAASGRVYVERAQVRPNGGSTDLRSRDALERLLQGQPLAQVRELEPGHFLQRASSGMQWEAQLTYRALQQILQGI